MKIEQLIVQYLYINKKVTLQDLGSFIISPDVIISSENEKEAGLPPDAISFESNSKALQDEKLVDFIVQHTRKIKPLASADLESFSSLSKQFLNLGKPLKIEGIGSLLKNQEGIYEFIQSNTSNAKLAEMPADVKEKQDEEIVFTTPNRQRSSKKGWIIFFVLLLAAFVTTAIYYFLHTPAKDNSLVKIVPVTDTSTQAKSTGVMNIADSSKRIFTDTMKQTFVKNDGITFKVVIKQYPTKMAAEKAYTRLKSYGNNVILSSKDSMHYQLAIPFTSPLSDTLRAKDSLAIFFKAKTVIDLN